MTTQTAISAASVAMPAYRLHARDVAAKTSTYVKDDPRTQIRTYLIFQGDGTIRVGAPKAHAVLPMLS